MAELLKTLELQENNTSGEYLEEIASYKEGLVTASIKKYLPDVSITKVSVVQNNYLRAMYNLKKEEYMSRYGRVTERQMLHATSEYKVDSIISNNLDWRMVSRNKFGIGVSFSEDADYANFHCNHSNGSNRAFIVANVLVGNEVAGHANMQVPPNYTDTAIGNNKKVYVKFNDNDFLPLYVVYYDAPERTTSKYYQHFRGRRRFLF